MKEINMESINETYRQLAELIGMEKTLKIYRNYKGLQVSFPTRLYDRKHVIKQAIEANKKGKSIKHLAIKYEYSERWIREMLVAKKNEGE